MDNKLLNILVCPETKAPLKLSKDGNELICKAAAVAYPIKDGVPVLLMEQARPLSDIEKQQQ
jgi:uncharacterized protein